MALRNGGRTGDWFLLAMALARKGEKEKALRWFDKAVERAESMKFKDVDGELYWPEAARLLGRSGPAARAPAIPKSPPRGDPR